MDEIDNFFNDCPIEVKEKDDYVIGIDLGTCMSCAGIWRNNTFEVIPDEYGNRTIPSVVAFTNKDVYVGYEARNQLLLNPKNTIYEVKRLMGKKINDSTVISDRKFLAYDLCPDENDNVNIMCSRGGKQVIITPEVISSYILMKLKTMASEYLKSDIKRAVITVPAYFNDAQRQATKDAATIAGLKCERILNEPSSSAIAYGLMKVSKNTNTNVIVYDLGGGTLDISLLRVSDGIFEVVQSAGNTHLGGVDFDNRLVNYCINIFKQKHVDFDEKLLGIDNRQKLYRACETAKKVLSTSVQTTIGVVSFCQKHDLLITLTRDKFNEICNDLLVFCLKPLDDILTSEDLKRDEVNEIILVGGMTRVVAIRENIQRYFNKTPNSSINPDEIVANGAAIQGYMLMTKTIDPFLESITLLDTIPLSLGVETKGDIMSIMIPRNTPIPTSVKRVYSNDTAGETSVTIRVFEGERKMTKDNFFVGEFELSGLKPANIGFHKIEVKFEIDLNGMITVSAIDLRYDNKKSICVTGHCGRLTDETIQKMLIEAQEFEQHDKIRKHKKKLHYDLCILCDNVIKNIEFRQSEMLEEDRENIIIDIENVRKSILINDDDSPIDIYEKEITRIKEKYNILTFPISNEQYNVAGLLDNNNGTSVYQDDDADEKTRINLIATELGCCENDSTYVNELKQLRDSLVVMCNDILDILNSPCSILKQDDIVLLKDYISDLLIWIHVQQKITIDDCNEKMNELTKLCNERVSSVITPTDNMNDKNELQLLCTTIQNSISSDSLGLNEEIIDVISSQISDTIEWLNTEHEQIEYQVKIEQLNKVCNDLYDKMIQKD